MSYEQLCFCNCYIKIMDKVRVNARGTGDELWGRCPFKASREAGPCMMSRSDGVNGHNRLHNPSIHWILLFEVHHRVSMLL